VRNSFSALCILLLIISGCSRSTTDLKNFDEEAWKKDENGCMNMRSKMIDNLITVKDDLKGLDQDHLIALLGKPDRQELYKRSQKFFYYQITPDASCGVSDAGANIYLSIRFNATGLSKEVIVMNYVH